MPLIRTAHQDIWRLAWPLILSNITVPLLGIVDTAVVGHLPVPHHLGAVALGASAFSSIFFTVISLRMGTIGLIAQAYGAGDRVELQAGFFRALALALIASSLFVVLSQPIIEASRWIFAPSQEVGAGLAVYLQIRLYAAPAAFANTVILGWLLGAQDAKGPLYLLLFGNGLNIILDVLFVFGLGFEVAGVAWATVAAEYTTLLLGGWLVRRRFGSVEPRLSWNTVMDWPAMRRLAAVNGDIVLRSLILQIAFVALSALSSRQGDIILAANTILLHMLHLSAYALDGFADAASTLVGRHVGRADRRAMRSAVAAGLIWSLAFALMIMAAYAVSGQAFIWLMTGIEEVRAAATTYFIYALFGPLLGSIAFLFDGVFCRRHPHGGDEERHAVLPSCFHSFSMAPCPGPGQSRALARLPRLHGGPSSDVRHGLLVHGAG